MKQKKPALTEVLIKNYATHLREQERSTATIQKYTRDLTALLVYLDGQPLAKAALIGWKEHLTQTYAPASVNSMLAAVNGYLSFMGWRSSR